jgi:hypothetical protein
VTSRLGTGKRPTLFYSVDSSLSSPSFSLYCLIRLSHSPSCTVDISSLGILPSSLTMLHLIHHCTVLSGITHYILPPVLSCTPHHPSLYSFSSLIIIPFMLYCTVYTLSSLTVLSSITHYISIIIPFMLYCTPPHPSLYSSSSLIILLLILYCTFPHLSRYSPSSLIMLPLILYSTLPNPSLYCPSYLTTLSSLSYTIHEEVLPVIPHNTIPHYAFAHPALYSPSFLTNSP